MKIHHLNCGSMCPWGGKLLKTVFPSEVICHCFLIETNDGLILVDTGLGENDFKDTRRLGLMSHFLGVSGGPEEAAVHQIKKLGFSPDDVRHIIPTHLDLDHAGGIIDFPKAKVHTLEPEYKMAMNPNSFLNKQRYRGCHWSTDTQWVVHQENYGEKWFGFDAVREIPDLPPEVLIIPLFGHTAGHFGVAVQTDSGWVLHAGDSYYDHRELTLSEPPLIGWKMFQRIVHSNYSKAMQNQKRLHHLATNNQDSIKVVCSHDSSEFHSCTALQPTQL
jgi:glyoxylase-like metal-dependent hydrolase (beta-lactamase superfamily II)